MICSSCSQELPDRALFCPRCGFQFLKSQTRNTAEKSPNFEVHRSRPSDTASGTENRRVPRSGDDLALFSSRFDAWLDSLSAAVTRNIAGEELLKSLQGPRGIRGLRLLKSFYRKDRTAPDFPDAVSRIPDKDAGFAAAVTGFQKLVIAGTGNPEAYGLIQDLGFLEGLSETDPEGIKNAMARLSGIQERLAELLMPEDPPPETPPENKDSPFSGTRAPRERLRFSSDTGNSEEEEQKSRERAGKLRNFRGLSGLYSDIRSTSGIKPPPPPKAPASSEPDLSGSVTDPRSYQGLRGMYRTLGSKARTASPSAPPAPARHIPFPKSPKSSPAPEPESPAENAAGKERLFRKELTGLVRSFHGMHLAIMIDLTFRFFPGLNIISFAIHAGILIRTRGLSRSCAIFLEKHPEYGMPENSRKHFLEKCRETEDDLPVLWGMYILNVFFGILTLWLALELALDPERAFACFDGGEPSDILLAQTAGLLLVWALGNVPDLMSLRNFLAVKKKLYGMTDSRGLS